jgi:FkbM family methyltransferase
MDGMSRSLIGVFSIIIAYMFSADLCAFSLTGSSIQSQQIYNVPGLGKFYVDGAKDYVKEMLRTGNGWEVYTLDLISKYARPGTVVVDIGAHIGTMTIPMARAVGVNGAVVAFEPQKHIFSDLVRNVALNQYQDRVSCYQMAVGDAEKWVEVALDLNNECGSAIVELGRGDEVVEMRTLDSFHLKNVSLIKIDVERQEEIVLDGMVNTIRDNRPVLIIEIQGGYLFNTAPVWVREQILRTCARLESMGYIVSNIQGHDYLALPK